MSEPMDDLQDTNEPLDKTQPLGLSMLLKYLFLDHVRKQIPQASIFIQIDPDTQKIPLGKVKYLNQCVLLIGEPQ